MKAICYNNTLTRLPNWNPNDNVHFNQSLGFAYEDENFFIHLYGWDTGFKGISIGLTVVEGKNTGSTKGMSLNDWVIENFGATNIKETINEIGHSIKGVWRPGLYYNDDIHQAIGFSEHEIYLSEQSIRILIQKLDEVFLYVEPNQITKTTFSHKIRELLILCCTEVENFWKPYLVKSGLIASRAGFTTNDYIKLKDKLYLSDFEFTLISYPDLGPIVPFEHWNPSNPTQSLFWYNAYNQTKHDRGTHFSQANLWNTINAIVACLILHCVKFGPFTMFEGNNHFSSVVKQHFAGKLLRDCKETFYIPKIEIPASSRKDKFVFSPKKNGFTNEYEAYDLQL